jgi:hypothetical protein
MRIKEMEIHSNDRLDENLVNAIRSVYAAPGATGYWDSLESRIMARVESAASASRDMGWYSVLARWATPGLAAAALLLAVAGALWSHIDQTELRNTYEGFTQPMVADATPGATQLLNLPRDGSSRREATLSYVLSH